VVKVKKTPKKGRNSKKEREGRETFEEGKKKAIRKDNKGCQRGT